LKKGKNGAIFGDQGGGGGGGKQQGFLEQTGVGIRLCSVPGRWKGKCCPNQGEESKPSHSVGGGKKEGGGKFNRGKGGEQRGGGAFLSFSGWGGNPGLHTNSKKSVSGLSPLWLLVCQGVRGGVGTFYSASITGGGIGSTAGEKTLQSAPGSLNKKKKKKGGGRGVFRKRVRWAFHAERGVSFERRPITVINQRLLGENDRKKTTRGKRKEKANCYHRGGEPGKNGDFLTRTETRAEGGRSKNQKPR